MDPLLSGLVCALTGGLITLFNLLIAGKWRGFVYLGVLVVGAGVLLSLPSSLSGGPSLFEGLLWGMLSLWFAVGGALLAVVDALQSRQPTCPLPGIPGGEWHRPVPLARTATRAVAIGLALAAAFHVRAVLVEIGSRPPPFHMMSVVAGAEPSAPTRAEIRQSHRREARHVRWVLLFGTLATIAWLWRSRPALVRVGGTAIELDGRLIWTREVASCSVRGRRIAVDFVDGSSWVTRPFAVPTDDLAEIVERIRAVTMTGGDVACEREARLEALERMGELRRPLG